MNGHLESTAHPSAKMTPLSKRRFDVAFGVGISHYSRLNGVNQDLVEFRRGIDVVLSDR